METNVNSVIGDPSLKKLVVTEQRPPMWNATFSSFFPNQVRIHCLLSLSTSDKSVHYLLCSFDL